MSEIKVLREINSPNIMQFVAVYETQNSIYLILELLNGGEVFKVENGAPSSDETYFIMK